MFVAWGNRNCPRQPSRHGSSSPSCYILELRDAENFRINNGSNWNMRNIFLAIAVAGLAIGFIFHKVPVVDGAGKAVFGVFFILYFLSKLFEFLSSERPETTHDHGGLMGKGGHGHH